MDNIIRLETTDKRAANLALRNRGYGGANFGVSYSSLFLGNLHGNIRVPKKYASVRQDTGTILGIHSDSYKPLEHRDMIDNQRDVIVRSGLADGSIQESISIDRTGKKCFVRHELPNHTIVSPTGDTANLTFLSTNSFCGTWAYIIAAGAKLGACQNNQVFVNDAATLYKARHNRHLDIDHAADVITNAVPIFLQQSELWHQWHDTKCNDYKALKIFATLLNNSTIHNVLAQHMGHSENSGRNGVILDANGKYLFDRDEVKKSRNFMYLWNKWDTHYRNVLGANLWGVYNTMTDWSTHVQTKSVNIASIQHSRETKVQRVIDQKNWGFAA